MMDDDGMIGTYGDLVPCRFFRPVKGGSSTRAKTRTFLRIPIRVPGISEGSSIPQTTTSGGVEAMTIFRIFQNFSNQPVIPDLTSMS